MRTSIDELLKEKNREVKESVYALCERDIREFVVTAGNFFQMETAEKWLENLWIQEVFQKKMEQKKENEVYSALEKQYTFIVKQIQDIKKADPKGYAHMEELRALRCVKKSIKKALGDMEEFYRSEAEQELQAVYQLKSREALVYKNTVCIGGFSDLVKRIPALEEIQLPWIRKCPLLLSDIPSLQGAVEQGDAIGIVGGPCLFGTYEVEILVSHRDGKIFSYDFSSGRRYDRKKEVMDFGGHVECYSKEITEISFQNRKRGLTAQEAESLDILFAFAKVLHAKVAIPIPDISYLKYLFTMLEPMDADFREQTVLKFRTETRKIADLYLERIERLKKQYPQVEVKVLHERDEVLLKEFHEKRELYFQKSGLIHRLTSKRKKTDAIFDYISMLALPFYFWGTPHVIQIDNLDETDSYRKCRKVHKSAFTLSSILYPERLSINGKDTIFNAPLAYKEYLEEEKKN